MPEQGEGRLPDGPPFSYEVGQRALSGPHLRRIGLIVEARQRGRIAAADAERPVGEDPLAIGQVAQYLLDAPLLRRVAVVAPGFGHTLEPVDDLVDLIRQDRDHVFVICDAGDVAGQGRGVLFALGARWCDHGRSRSEDCCIKLRRPPPAATRLYASLKGPRGSRLDMSSPLDPEIQVSAGP